tara:strand:+ start:168 stop:404 length:237 start_codon:yes stop_codon:yes gene_type:complete
MFWTIPEQTPHTINPIFLFFCLFFSFHIARAHDPDLWMSLNNRFVAQKDAMTKLAAVFKSERTGVNGPINYIFFKFGK